MSDVTVTSTEGETHLRRVAEAELRGMRDGYERVTLIARALRTVGVLDEAAAEAILADFGLARQVRLPDQPSPSRRGMIRRPVPSGTGRVVSGYSGVGTYSSQFVSGGGMAPAPAPVTERLLPVDVRMPLTSDDASGELHLMAYIQTLK